jgi:virginiamycin B lyase
MIRSITIPADWMTAHSPRLRPQFVQNTPNWSQLPGSVAQVVVSPSDGSLWALVDTGGPDYPIAHYSGGVWAIVPGDASRIAINPYGDTLWAVNAEGGIYEYNVAGQTWTGIGGSASDIAVGADNSIYVLSNADADAGGNFPIWHYAGGIWTSIPGSGYRIAGSWDTNSYPISGVAKMYPGGFFVFTADTGSDADGNGIIYYYSPGVGYEQVPGQVQAIAPVTGGVFAVGGSAGAGTESPIYFYEYASQGWTGEAGDGVSVAASQSALYSVTSANALWTMPLVLRDPIITEYPIPTASSGPTFITAGSDGALWFTEVSGNKIGRITGGGTITEYPIPSAGSNPSGLIAGPDGALWFTEASCTGRLAQITTSGSITEYPIPSSPYCPGAGGITTGPDGNLWFAEGNDGNQIVKATTTGAFSFSSSGLEPYPALVTTGPDGNLWFTEYEAGYIGRITTSGTITGQFALPGGQNYGQVPIGIATGSDGALWFTDNNGNNIGRITTSGTITQFSGGLSANSAPYLIVTGPDGALWFTEQGSNSIGRITTGGAITNYPVPTPSSVPYGIGVGPDGAIWFTEHAGNKIGRISLQ